MLAQKNLYAELRLQPTASASEIRIAYRRAALFAHPDKGGSAAAFHSIAFAFEVLSCPVSRQLYDQAHAQWSQMRHHAHRSKFVGMRYSKVPKSTTPHTTTTCGQKRKRDPAPTTNAPKQPRTTSEPTPECTEMQSDGGGNDEGEPGAGPDHPAPKGHDTDTAVEHVRAALQGMTATQRRDAIVQMPNAVRNELMKYMKTHKTNGPDADAAAQSRKSAQKNFEAWSRGTGIRTLQHIYKTSYQVQLRIRHLRMETKAHADFETAISVQMVLVRVRHALEAAGEVVWSDPNEFHKVFTDVLENAGVTQEDLGLSVFIFMRAEEWIGRFATITSPVMPLKDAVAAHSRLVVARQLSWAHVRAEWVHLMLQTQQARTNHMTPTHAEAVVEKVRVTFLQHCLKRAVKSAERAIKTRQHLKLKVAKLHARAQRQKAKETTTAARAAKRAARERLEELAARRRWYARADLTMEEMMQGPPRQM